MEDIFKMSEEQRRSRSPRRGDVEVEEQQEVKEEVEVVVVVEDSEEEEEEEDEEDEEGMEDSPLVALAPDASLPKEQPSAGTDVTASPVFLCLDELLSFGKINRTKVSKLKSSYRLLHDTLKRAQDSEMHLLGEAKRCRAELERLQAEVERTEEQGASVEPESEVNELRQQLLQAYNELEAAEDREYKTQYQLKCLLEEKQYLEKENEIEPEPAELDSRTKALQDKYEELKKDVFQRQLEVRSLTEDVETCETQILKEQKELEDKMEIIELKKAEKKALISTPDQIFKEIQRKRAKWESAMEKTEALNAEISEMEQEVKQAAERNSALTSKKKKLNEELKGPRAQIDEGHGENRMLLKEQEVNREDEAELMGNKGILEIKLRNIMSDRKHLYESHSLRLRENNRQAQALKRMELALTMATEHLEHTQSVYDDLQAQLDAVPKHEAGIERRMELQKEVDALKVSFEKQQLNQHIQEELLEKDLIIMDHKKLNTMLQRRVSQHHKLCGMITEEKNKYVKLKQVASQTITELTEQVKVLENETEIQSTIVNNKDRSLTKTHMKISNSSQMRDKLRNDICEVSLKHHQISQEYEDNKLELMKLTKTINLQEQAFLDIEKNHETATQRRNELSVQFLEHEEVLLSHDEKMNVQAAAITKGNMTLETLEKEMRDMQLEINEEERQIELKKKEVLLNKRLEGEITTLVIELSEARDKTVECLNRTVDSNELKGEDISTVELVKKIEKVQHFKLEMNLAVTERRSLEKELLVDQVTRLSKPLSEQAENCQQDRLSLAKKLNELRTHIIDTNHRMMAVSAELSMKQAAALSLQQEMKEKELQMDRCQRQLEQGLPPCPEMEKEWRRMLRDKKRRQRDKEERERLAEEEGWYQLPNGEYTTAESRPDAYIPQTDLLPLPKPYGALAPFKPSQPGANMRHIRKPTLKPLEI
ncbi:coiled-coil domain-containing protein 146 isoform X4 [Sebastes umbrosus]|uniref:coiled-coil domain-containing protein 146 isoform X4 n=1 Tax=Sebastes umbrosus TaxID=72105 RepID=UPI00189E9848|nr:coiled-coil domain-containing protein 146 isoform X4 [Sebastes umbrosus]